MPDTNQNIQADQSATGPHRRDGALFLLSSVICVVVILGLVVVARGKGSAQGPGPDSIPTPNLTADQACQTWAHYWIDESGVNATAQIIEGFSNCRLGKDGTWFIPTNAQDARLPSASMLTNVERQQTSALRFDLNAQLLALRTEFPQGLHDWLDNIYSPRPDPVLGNVRDDVRISATRGRYTRLVQAFLMNPRYAALSDYVGWLMARRQQSYAAFLAGCSTADMSYLTVACQGIGDRLSVEFPPWPWELSSSVYLDSYLKWALENGKVSPAASDATPGPSQPHQLQPQGVRGRPD